MIWEEKRRNTMQQGKGEPEKTLEIEKLISNRKEGPSDAQKFNGICHREKVKQRKRKKKKTKKKTASYDKAILKKE